MENIEKAKENIKEALYGIYAEGKDDEKWFGPLNGNCIVCGKPIRKSEGYVCCKCGWEFDYMIKDDNTKSLVNFKLSANEYRKLCRELKKELFEREY